MDLIQHTQNWVKGEVFQGKIMLAIGFVLLLAFIGILKGDQAILKGMIIPLGLMVLIQLGYGGMQVFYRPTHIGKVEKLIQENPQAALDKELAKAQNDDRVYTMAKRVWPILILLSIVLFFVFSSDYLKGLSVGLMALFMSILILDLVLHYRLETYLRALE